MYLINTMNARHLKNLKILIVLGLLALISYFIKPYFGKGLFVGLGIAVCVYVIREFLPKRP